MNKQVIMKKQVIMGVFFLGLMAVPIFSFLYENTTSAIRVAYVEWGLVQLIEEYAEKNQGNLPNSWNDLETLFEPQGNLISCDSLDEVRLLFDVDFPLLNDCKGDSSRHFIVRKQFSGYRSIIDCNGRLLELKTKHCQQIQKDL